MKTLSRVVIRMRTRATRDLAVTSDTNETPRLGTYDTGVPPKLLSFMLKNWNRQSSKSSKAMPDAASFIRRRERLSRRFPGDLLIVPAGHRKVRANDMYYPFRPGSDFYYLTGALEPECVLVLLPNGKTHQHLLFVEPNLGKTDARFFTDRDKGELWDGPRLGVAECETRYAVTCRSLAELEPTIRAVSATRNTQHRILRGLSASTESLVGAIGKVQTPLDDELAVFLSEMRLIKDASEIKALQDAVSATKRGFDDVIARLRTAKTERELEGAFWARARMEGNEPGYPSVVASGAHACTLHWMKNDGALRKGDLLLLDAGIEGHTFYTADVTRTLPISGKFNRVQRAVYEIVLDAQRAALEAVRPGNDFIAPHDAAMAVLARGLERLGILSMSAAEALQKDNQFYRRYSLHNVSHMLGLDVHDCSKARAEKYRCGKLEAGMVLTVEPGLYFQTDDLTVPAKYRGIGIRIEDDVLVTDNGHRVLSAALPREPDKVENWMRQIWKRR
jgi:Xaa-Pro aminopeptidase